MNKTISAKADQEKNLFLCAARGLAVSALTAILASILSCLISLSLDDPDKYTKIFALVSLFIASGIGGHITARARGKNAFLCGLVLGIMIVGLIVTLCLSLTMPINMSLFAICAPSVLVTAILGAITGVGKQKKNKPKKKRKF